MSYVFALVTLALFGLLGRELWRAIGRPLLALLLRRAKDPAIAAKVDAAMKTTGATPERPFEVTSASVVEAQATSSPCVVCEADVYAEDHSVDTTTGEPLRVVNVHCRRCGHRRPIYVRIVRDLVH